MGKIIAFLGKQLQKECTHPTIIHGNIIPNQENSVNRIEKKVNFECDFVVFVYFCVFVLNSFVHYAEFLILISKLKWWNFNIFS